MKWKEVSRWGRIWRGRKERRDRIIGGERRGDRGEKGKKDRREKRDEEKSKKEIGNEIGRRKKHEQLIREGKGGKK